MRLTTTIDINAPAEVVWACIEEPEKILQWVEGTVGHRYLTPAEDGTRIGRQFEQKLKQGKDVVTFIGTITHCEEPQHFAFHIPSPAYSSDAHFRLSALRPDVTQVFYSIDVELHTLKAKIVGFLLRLPLTFFVPKQLQRLKQLAESLVAKDVDQIKE
jgi:Polyketide cyclase / dehydrase and lipid transport